MNGRSTAALLLFLAALPAACRSPADAPAGSRTETAHRTPTGEHGGAHAHRFENAEEWARRFEDPERAAWQKPGEVAALMRIEPGMTVADIGAGTGYFLGHLSRAAGEKGAVLAIDIEPDMVRYMAERAAREGWRNVESILVPPDDPRLEPGSVHRILIVNTWHHIPDRRAYSAKLARALAPGGAVYVVDFTLESQKGPPRDHKLPPEQVIAELAAGGLDASLLEETLPEQYIILGKSP